jgi:hypothetical protein
VPMFLNPSGEVEGFRNGHDARNLGQTPSAMNPAPHHQQTQTSSNPIGVSLYSH